MVNILDILLLLITFFPLAIVVFALVIILFALVMILVEDISRLFLQYCFSVVSLDMAMSRTYATIITVF